MKTITDLKAELKSDLATCNHVNDNSLAAHVNENIQWAWNNWDIDFSLYFEGNEKPERYTVAFMEEWIENEDFDTELAAINE
jgi:hypothetical protein